MDDKTVSTGVPTQSWKSPLERMAMTGCMSESSLLRMAALVSRLSCEGIQESGVIRALTNFYPEYALLIQETLQSLDDDPLLTTVTEERDLHVTRDVMLNEVRSQDGEWSWHYEYPRGAEPVHSGGYGFTVYAVPDTSYVLFFEERVVRCIESDKTILLRITGDCQSITAMRGDVTPFGRSLGGSSGFFIAALQEGEAICVTNHRRTYARIYLCLDDIIHELSLEQWTAHFEPSLAPLD